MQRRSLVFILIAIAVGIVLAGCSSTTTSTTTPTSSPDATTLPSLEKTSFKEGELVMYKSSNCGCCGLYASYLKKKGFSVQIIQVDDVTPVKDELSIPQEVRSCHTIKVGKYFIEGHVPVEIVRKFLSEAPDADGIALPGMPSGAPGMPGSKMGPFIIYTVKNGSYEEYARV